MKYELTTKENNIVSLRFDDAAQIDAKQYSIICHNPMVALPGMRDLSVPNTINYDTLGSVPLSEELAGTVYTRSSLYDFVIGIIDNVLYIINLGIDQRQIVFDPQYLYVSLYDKAVKFICLPVSCDDIESDYTVTDMLRSIALSVKSSGAYELVGYIIENVASDDFSLQDFRNRLESSFGSGQSKAVQTGSSSASMAGVPLSVGLSDFEAAPAAESSVYTGREYVPSGIPMAFDAGSDAPAEAAASEKTQVLFSGSPELSDVPFLSPVDNNTPEARIYIVGSPFTIGRSPDNSLQINIPTVSGSHAEITRSSDGCCLTDLNSTNKTYVNGNPIKPNSPVKLKHQDLIAFNKSRYRFFEH